MEVHPFRFGLQVATAPSRAALAERARRAEGLGFSVLHLADHLDEVLPPLPGLVTVAEATTTLRVGTLVVNSDLRHPVVLAREAAAVDLLSDGRLELGLGAGHAEPEYRSAGVPFDRAPVRIARLGEALTIVKGLLAGEEVTFSGRYHRVTGHRVHPLPVQRPRPPVLVGGGGRLVLALAAREADIVGFTGLGAAADAGGHHRVPSGFSPASVDGQVAAVRAAAGDRAGDIELHALVQAVAVTDDRGAAVGRLGRHFPTLTPTDLEATPYLLVGSVDGLVEALQARRERFGISYYSVRDEALAPVVARLAGT